MKHTAAILKLEIENTSANNITIKEVKVKAAGGISSFDDAEKFISLGASRLGTSRIVKLAKNENAQGY